MDRPPDPFRRLEGALGWAFVDPSHLEAALVHRSYCAEHPDAVSNERLEFLGDAVLGLAVTDHVYETYPELPEGELEAVNFLRALAGRGPVPKPKESGPDLTGREPMS